MLWVKAFHIIFMVTWFAALFYLPRLFVYHAMSDDQTSHERFCVMERKLYRGIMNPSMMATVLFGALSTIIGLFILSRLPNVKPAVIYDPEFTAGRYGVYVEAEGSRLEEARKIMNAEEPIELREGAADA